MTTDVTRRDPAPPRRGWWRRNTAALIALALLVPASAAVVGLQEWTTGRTAFDAPPAAVVSTGDVVESEGARFGPATIADAPEVEAPPGTRAMMATVSVAPGPGPTVCSIFSLRERAGGERRWAPVSDPAWQLPAGTSTACPSDSVADDVRVAALFVVPDDAGPFGLDVAVGDDGHTVRFDLD